MVWNTEEPPVEPPDEADPIVWSLAHRVHLDHRPDLDGFCITCKEFWPCDPRGTAEHAMLLAAACRWQTWPVIR